MKCENSDLRETGEVIAGRSWQVLGGRVESAGEKVVEGPSSRTDLEALGKKRDGEEKAKVQVGEVNMARTATREGRMEKDFQRSIRVS